MKPRKRVVTGRAGAGRTPAPKRSPTVRRIRSAIVPARSAGAPIEPLRAASLPARDPSLGTAVDLSVALTAEPDLRLRNPILVAAGCAGYGPDVADALGLAGLGGIVTRTTTLRPRDGWPGPRLAEVPGALLWATGLPNPGIEAVLERYGPAWPTLPTAIIVSIAGETMGEVVEVARRLEDVPGVAAIELNLAELRPGGSDPTSLAAVAEAVRRATTRPLLAKLPYVEEPGRLARVVVEAGADVLAGPGGLRGRIIAAASREAIARRPAVGSGRGFLAGPALRPLVLDFVAELAAAVRVPVVALGGVRSVGDVLDTLAAGATAVGVGTAALADPTLPGRLVEALRRTSAAAGAPDLEALTAALRGGRSRGFPTADRTLSS